MLTFIGAAASVRASSLVPQTQLLGSCIPQFVTALPVFGPAGSTPRVTLSANAASDGGDRAADGAPSPLAALLSLHHRGPWYLAMAGFGILVSSVLLVRDKRLRAFLVLAVVGAALVTIEIGCGGSTSGVSFVRSGQITVTMKEIDQAVLPQGKTDTCGMGVTFGKTRVWAYETSDTLTGKVLGAANWPAVTLVAQRGILTQVTYVNQLPSFNPANPTGPGLVEGLLQIDQTIHWADPLNSGCGMTTVNCSESSSVSATAAAFAPARPDTKLSYCGRQAPALAAFNASSSSSPCCQQYIGPVPAVVHLHGGEEAAAFDGGPDGWFTPDGRTGPAYSTIGDPGPGKAIYEYPNAQEAGTLWFHDHALGITRNNVYAGLAGFYFIEDPASTPVNLPSGSYEIEMAVQDRMFDTNSQLYFPNEAQVQDHPFWSVTFEGDVATVNGAAFPYLKVEPRRYLFRMLNGAEHRSFVLNFGSAPVYLVGTDDTFFDKPVKVSDVPIDPGQRADIVVDFSQMSGQNITVTNTGLSDPSDITLPKVMQIQVVTPLRGPDLSCNPANDECVRTTTTVQLTDGQGNVAPGVKIDKVRQLVLNENFDVPTTLEESLSNTKWNGLESPSIAADFPKDGISELPRVGSTELWEIANIYYPGTETQTHPIHLHLAQFQVLNRQAITIAGGYYDAWNAAFGTGPVPLPSSCTPGQFCKGYGPPLSYTTPNADGALGGNPAFSPYLQGSVIPPSGIDLGWKDTVVANAAQVVRILVRWTPVQIPLIPNQSYAGTNFYDFDPTQGYYVWHCHLLTHEDNEMMRPYRVTN